MAVSAQNWRGKRPISDLVVKAMHSGIYCDRYSNPIPVDDPNREERGGVFSHGERERKRMAQPPVREGVGPEQNKHVQSRLRSLLSK